MQVKLYRNLNNGKISIMDPATRLVIGHADKVSVVDAEFVVNENGRQRVLQEKRKNVHAFLTGTCVGVEGFEGFRGRSLTVASGTASGARRVVKYNPYKGPFFTTRVDGIPIHRAAGATVDSTGHMSAVGAANG